VGLADHKGREGKGTGAWKSKHKSISWSSGPTETMRDFIAQLTDAGCGVLFSRTTDGGALVVSVYAGDDRSKEYITEPGDILVCFAYLTELYT